MRVWRLLLTCAAALAASGGASAHHSPAAYDLTQEVVIEGTIAELAWRNPHIYLAIETTGMDGAPALQQVEADAISTLQTAGVTREVLAPGARVSIRAAPNRRGPGHTVLGFDVTLRDGAIYPLGPRGRVSSAPPQAPAAESLAGKWAPSASAFSALMQAIPSWPLTETARAAREDVAGTLAAAAGCTPYPQPMLMGLHVLRTVEIEGDRVTIRLDWMGAERTVRLDLTEHPPDLEPSLLGHSIGWWEGDTLVIDTIGFAPHRQGAGFGVPAGPDKHMVERLSLTEDRRGVRYEFTLEEPEALHEPVTHVAVWEHRPDLEFSREDCDPEIARRFLEE